MMSVSKVSIVTTKSQLSKGSMAINVENGDHNEHDEQGAK